MKRLDELTGLRCIAVGMVLLGHSTEFLPAWTAKLGAFGDTGVQIFFVLSGFLITSLLKREYARTGKLDFWAFYRRRFLRISPAFYFFLAVLGLLAGVGVIDVGWQQFLISGTYLWNYARLLGIDGSYDAHPDGGWYLGHTWSLALEEQFYWIWPAVFLLISRRRLKWLLPATILAVPIIRMTSYFLEPSVRGQLHMMFHTGIDTILVGAYVAMNHEALTARLRPIVNSGRALALAAGILFFLIPKIQLLLGGFWIATYGATIEAALIGLMLLGMITQPAHWFCRLLRSRPFVFVGVISYSLYLWQQFFSYASSPVFMGFPLNVVGSVAAASLSYFIVERPFLILKDRASRVTSEDISSPDSRRASVRAR